MINNIPLVSVIMPVYNAEKYLYQCLNSLKEQTLKNIEIICVDDGSTDKSLNILKQFADIDKRFIILRQKNLGAAVARNNGIDISKGRYLIFLDSDDYFNTELLEKSLVQAQNFNADIVIFKALAFNTNTNKTRCLNDRISEYQQFYNKTFSVKDIPNDIFNSFLIAPWNKLYSKNFIKHNNLYFQNLKRSNDLFFTTSALAKAERMILLDEVLTYYRTGTKTNLQAGNAKTPFEFYKALKKLREFLVVENLYKLTQKSYIKLALETSFYNINSIKNKETKNRLIKFMNTEGFASLGIYDLPKIYKLDFGLYSLLQFIEYGNLFLFRSAYVIYKIKQYLPKILKSRFNG